MESFSALLQRPAQLSFDDIPFDGETYEHSRDAHRLGEQLKRVKQVMSDGQWRTLNELSELANAPEASVSARLRDLRKEKNGGHVVNRRFLSRGLFQYQLLLVDENGIIISSQ